MRNIRRFRFEPSFAIIYTEGDTKLFDIWAWRSGFSWCAGVILFRFFVIKIYADAYVYPKENNDLKT